ncbi:kinase-like domain-containing protein [Diplogelasinospora grovesii]|uniref:Kinase-like domain-containing protein n=1 Tax=Diplogelasinospora grovesii TaxID=303347 RepID=A0AAN6SAC1_9PEZI|nr:kinase-like domain-containing protein [Diplogelasinospora grovesii]
MWWDADTIERTVTWQFVCSHLLPEEIERLKRPLGFGDGLTDGTYWEWIDEKAKRIFLILVDLGVPDQIFGVIDDSWDDEDLPIALDQVERLALTPARDEKLEKKFYYRQYYYLLRPLQRGEHAVYQDDEVVPTDIIDKKPTALTTSQSHQFVDRVVLPNQPGMVFCRRWTPLGPGYFSYEDFLYEVSNIRNLQNEHLVSYWASYVYQGYGYVVFTPASDYTLKSFLTTTPASVKNLDKQVRRRLVMNWILCLVDTLCFIHNRGLSHGNIKPSTIMFTNDNHIFFSDFSRLSTEALASMMDSRNSFDKESYDYAAPEQWFRPTAGGPPSPVHRKASLTTPSSSPENYTHQNYAASRGGGGSAADYNNSVMHAPTPHLDAQAADVFSLGCVILELLSFLLKKQGRPFAAHRAAKHKTPGRGGAVPDASFHKNLGQVESWMTQLAKDASKKIDKDAQEDMFRGIAPMLHVVERMLALHPSDRPAAYDVQNRMYQIVTEACGITEPHCVHQYGGWDFGIGSLKLGTSPPTAMMTHQDMSIATNLNRRRSSATSGSRNSQLNSEHHHHHHSHHSRRTSTASSSGAGSSSMGIGSMLRRTDSASHREQDGGSGFQATFQNLRMGSSSSSSSSSSRAAAADKVRTPWSQAPVYAGNY